jgi:hypothetical protein
MATMPPGNLIGGNLVTPNQPSILTVTEIAPNLIPGGAEQVLTWSYAQSFQLISVTRDVNGAITTATISWPDGATGIFTTDVASVSFPGAIDAWHATYATGTTSFTVTQPLVTRDTTGAITVQPAITIS